MGRPSPVRTCSSALAVAGQVRAVTLRAQCLGRSRSAMPSRASRASATIPRCSGRVTPKWRVDVDLDDLLALRASPVGVVGDVQIAHPGAGHQQYVGLAAGKIASGPEAEKHSWGGRREHWRARPSRLIAGQLSSSAISRTHPGRHAPGRRPVRRRSPARRPGEARQPRRVGVPGRYLAPPIGAGGPHRRGVRSPVSVEHRAGTSR